MVPRTFWIYIIFLTHCFLTVVLGIWHRSWHIVCVYMFLLNKCHLFFLTILWIQCCVSHFTDAGQGSIEQLSTLRSYNSWLFKPELIWDLSDCRIWAHQQPLTSCTMQFSYDLFWENFFNVGLGHGEGGPSLSPHYLPACVPKGRSVSCSSLNI